MNLSQKEINVIADRLRKLSHPLKPIPTGTESKLTQLKNVRAVIYDFYGTLFVSDAGDINLDEGSADETLMSEALLDAGVQSTRHQAGQRALELYNQILDEDLNALKRKGIEFPEPDIHTVWLNVLEELTVNGLISGSVDPFTAARLAVEFEARHNPAWPSPQAVSTLRYFKKKGLLQGIISNSQFYTPLLLEALTDKTIQDLGIHNELLHWSFEEKMKKPGLEFYRRFHSKIKRVDSYIKAEQVLYVGNDMLKDIYPAAALGFRTALFAGDSRSLKWRKNHDKCKNLTPDLIITGLEQLTECVT